MGLIPSRDFNVVMVSLPRCAAGWVYSEIAEAHHLIYQEFLNWEELDKVDRRKVIPFIDTRLEMPEGWFQMYNVSPQLLIHRGYDKVIVIKRDRDVWVRVELLYYLKSAMYCYEQGIETDFEWIKDIDKKETLRRLGQQWDDFYKTVPENDNQIYTVSLEDLNSHTKDTFYELLDFLEFKRSYRMVYGRPPMWVVKTPFRNWEKYSCDLPRKYEYANSLEMIGEIYDKTLLRILDEEIETFL